MVDLPRKLPIPEGAGIVSWRDCPDCNGRGWFLKNPFATGGGLAVVAESATCCNVAHANELMTPKPQT